MDTAVRDAKNIEKGDLVGRHRAGHVEGLAPGRDDRRPRLGHCPRRRGLLDRRRARAVPVQTLRTAAGRADAAAALVTLISDIGNNSNLILDPDLDSGDRGPHGREIG